MLSRILVTSKVCCLAPFIAEHRLGDFGVVSTFILGGTTIGRLGPKIYLMMNHPDSEAYFYVNTLLCHVDWGTEKYCYEASRNSYSKKVFFFFFGHPFYLCDVCHKAYFSEGTKNGR